MTKISRRPSPYQDTKDPTKVLALVPIHSSNPFWKAASIYAATDAVGFVVSVLTGSHVHLDLIGSGAFGLVSLSNLFSQSSASSLTLAQKVSSIAVSVWSIKLAAFLFYRASRVGHDMRLEETLSTVGGTFGFWFVTFIWNMACSMPYLLGLLSTRSNPLFVNVGSVVYSIGLLVETIADLQKWWFKQSHPGKFCNVGLWALSQHPNFFGNLVLWLGIFLINVPAFLHPSTGYRPRLALALISPLFLWSLLYGEATGAVTNAKQLALDKYGHDMDYQKYIQQVPVMIPKLW